jgi:hypothetical protein
MNEENSPFLHWLHYRERKLIGQLANLYHATPFGDFSEIVEELYEIDIAAHLCTVYGLSYSKNNHDVGALELDFYKYAKEQMAKYEMELPHMAYREVCNFKNVLDFYEQYCKHIHDESTIEAKDFRKWLQKKINTSNDKKPYHIAVEIFATFLDETQ